MRRTRPPRSLAAVLTGLAEAAATGGVSEPEGATVWLRQGLVYAVAVATEPSTVGLRLASAGLLGLDALDDALAVQRAELTGWRLGELLVELGHVDQEWVGWAADEQLRDTVARLLGRPPAPWRFRPGHRVRADVARPAAVPELLAEAQRRADEWSGLAAELGGADPVLAATGTAVADGDTEAAALLAELDGQPLGELAGRLGLSRLEAAEVATRLVRAGAAVVADPGPVLEAPYRPVDWSASEPEPADPGGGEQPVTVTDGRQRAERAEALAGHAAAGGAEPVDGGAGGTGEEPADRQATEEVADQEPVAEPAAEAAEAPLGEAGEAGEAAEAGDAAAAEAGDAAADEPGDAPLAEESDAPAGEESVNEQPEDGPAPASVGEQPVDEAAAGPADDEPEDDEPAEPWPAEPPAEVPAPRSELADTAALMRELSSLNQEEDAEPPATYARSTPVAAAPPRRRGLFGRG